jgi:hypothetical protein
MIPRTFPSTYASNGQQQMVVHFLTSVAGLARWSDYIPVKLVQGGPENSYSGTIDVAVIPSLTAQTQAWKEYIPVYVDDAGTDAWTVNNIGYIPYNYALFTDASMQLDLTNGGALDPRVTFTRTSNATVTDSTGTLVYAPHNLLTFSEQFDNAAWTKLGVTVAGNFGVAPNGTSTADSLIEATTTGEHQVFNNNIATTQGFQQTFSVYIKAGTASKAIIRTNLLGTGFLNSGFDLALGTVTRSPSGITATISEAGSGWYRCAISGVVVTAGTRTISVNMTLTDPIDDSQPSYTGDTSRNLLLWGAQLNVGSLQPYYPTTVKNLLGFTQEFDNAGWTKSGASVSANVAAAPDGSMTADKVIVNNGQSTIGNDSAGGIFQNPAGTSAIPYVYSFFAKAAEVTSVRIRETVSTGARARISLVDGSVIYESGSSANFGVTATDVGNGWWRVAAYRTPASTLGYAIKPGIDTGDGTSGIFIWGAQLSDSASLDPYVYNPGAAPASTAYFGPRFDYDPVTLAPKGLLIEEQRTNLFARSEEFENAAWTKIRASITANTIVAPNGTLTGDKLVEDTTATASHAVVTGSSLDRATQRAISVYVKAAERSFVCLQDNAFGGNFIRCFFNLSTLATTTSQAGNGTVSSASITAVGNGWYRCVLVGTPNTVAGGTAETSIFSAVSNIDFSYTGDGFSGIFIWGAQLEAGAFPTSYIPTTTATATRAADVAVMTGANFSNWYNQTEGSFFVDAQPGPITSGAFPRLLHAANEDNSSRIQMLRYNINIPRVGVVVSGVAQAAFDTPNTWASGVVGEMAFAVKQNDFAAVFAGGTPATVASGNMPTLTRLNIGSEHVSGGNSVSFNNGHIRRLAFFPRRLADAELTAITS